MNIKHSFFLILILQTLFLSCKTTDKALDKEAPIPSQFRGSEAEQVATAEPDSASIALIPWQDFFTDPLLKDLIDTAIVHNMDMQLAIKNIESAQLTLRQAKAGYLPDVSLRVAANTNRPSDNSLNGISLNQFLGSTHLEDYTAALNLSWEADIWGKIKSQKTAALASYLQTEEARKAVQTQIVSYVAQGYYNLLMLREQLRIANRNLALNDSTLQIIQQQYDVGEITQLAVEQAEAQRLTAASLIPDFEQQIAIQENALSILSGRLPAGIETHDRLSNIPVPTHLTTGVPSLLLSRRPDVKQAELAVVAARANQQYARASMYPSLVISAQGGVNAFKASEWFNIPSSLFGTVAGAITQPILQRRQLKTNYQLAGVEQEKAVIQFKQSVISAAGEVSDALIAFNKLQQRQSIALDRTKKLQSAIHNADLLFDTGMANYLEVITAQSNVLQSELELAQIKKAQLVSVVDLYRSLGGGW